MNRKSDLNIEIIPETLAGEYDLPTLCSSPVEPPQRLIPFNQAKGMAGGDMGVHFFIDDYQFERVWRSPRRYAELLKPFRCVFTPDFSLYTDMPLAMKLWNVYRSRTLGVYWKSLGLDVIPTLQWAEPRTYGFCFSGIQTGGTVAVSTLGAAKGRLEKQLWTAGMKEAIRQIRPSTILLYGSPIDFDFGSIRVIHYENETIKRLRNYGR